MSEVIKQHIENLKENTPVIERKMPIHFSARRIYIKLVTKDTDNLFFLYDVDPFSPLAPQLEKCLADAEHLPITSTIRGNDETFYLGIIER